MKSSIVYLTLSLLTLVVFWSCSPDRNAQNWIRKTTKHWAKLERRQPAWLETLDSSALHTQLFFLNNSQEEASTWLAKPLDPAIKTNLIQLRDELKTAQTRLQLQQTDPSIYNFGLRLRHLYSAKTTLQSTDLEKLENYLDQVPLYYQRARQKLRSPEPSLCDTAVQQHIKGITFLRGPLQEQLENDQIPVEKRKLLSKKKSSVPAFL